MFTEKDYVSTETSDLLKLKGFKEPINYTVPSLYEAQNWLIRKGLYVCPRLYEEKGWYWIINDSNNGNLIHSQLSDSDMLFSSFEKAMDEGIKKAIEFISNEERKIYVSRPKEKGDVEVSIMFDRNTNKYCFVNLTKGHVCKCRFDNYNDAISDLDNEVKLGNVNYYRFI